jgi:hypothetical protein
MKNIYSGQQIIKQVFKDQLSYVTLVKWCRKGILNPYHRTSSFGNRHDKSLFTIADAVLAGVINNIFACGITHEKLLGMSVVMTNADASPWQGHKEEFLHPDSIPSPMPILWRDLGRQIQQLLAENRFKVMFQIQCAGGEETMRVFCLEDTEAVRLEHDMLFGSNMGYAGAIIYINAKLIHNAVRWALDPRNMSFSG